MPETMSVVRIRHVDSRNSLLVPLYTTVTLGPYKCVGKLNHIIKTLYKKPTLLQHSLNAKFCTSLISFFIYNIL